MNLARQMKERFSVFCFGGSQIMSIMIWLKKKKKEKREKKRFSSSMRSTSSLVVSIICLSNLLLFKKI